MMHETLEVDEKSELGRREKGVMTGGQESHLLVVEGEVASVSGNTKRKRGVNMGYHGPPMQRTDAG